MFKDDKEEKGKTFRPSTTFEHIADITICSKGKWFRQEALQHATAGQICLQ